MDSNSAREAIPISNRALSYYVAVLCHSEATMMKTWGSSWTSKVSQRLQGGTRRQGCRDTEHRGAAFSFGAPKV